MGLSISTEARNDFTVIHVGGDLDVYTAPRLKESLDEAIAGGSRLILDLSEVEFSDSTALGVLVGARQGVQANHGDLRLVVGDPFLLKIFHITGFDGIFAIYPQIEEAITGD